MKAQYCYALREGEVLHADYPEWPLFNITIHGSDRERVKISKRLMCAVKHLPLRLQVHYEKNAINSIEKGISKDPTIVCNDHILLEGLVSAEEITETFKNLLKESK